MIFLGVRPSSARRTVSSANVAASTSFGDAVFGTVISGALLAVDLHRQGHAVVFEQRRIGLRPGRLRDIAAAAGQWPALFGQVRHHWGDELHQDAAAALDAGAAARSAGTA